MMPSKQVHTIALRFQGLKMTPFLNEPLYCKFIVTVDEFCIIT